LFRISDPSTVWIIGIIGVIGAFLAEEESFERKPAGKVSSNVPPLKANKIKFHILSLVMSPHPAMYVKSSASA